MIHNIKKALFELIIVLNAFRPCLLRGFWKDSKPCITLAILVEEFFHKDLRGFGGFGITAQRVANYLNHQNHAMKVEVLLTSMLNEPRPIVKKYHETPVVFRSNQKQRYVLNFWKYSQLTNRRAYNVLLCIDWYESYEYAVKALPRVPLLIWIRDPRSMVEWKKIATVPLELQASGESHKSGDIERIVKRKTESLHRVIKLSRQFNRKIIFATAARCLVERAQRCYGLSNIEPSLLPNPIGMPIIKKPNFSSKPSVCFLARLQPLKRPWVYFELAKRFPKVDFLVGGITHNPGLMEPIIKKYSSIPNLKFLGLVTDERKHELLNRVWALVNTSIWEGLPCSFLETFSYEKPVISCQNPDDLVNRFGWYTGEILGEGLDDASLDRFSEAIEECLLTHNAKEEKGMLARRYVEENHTFPKFRENLDNILKMAGLASA